MILSALDQCLAAARSTLVRLEPADANAATQMEPTRLVIGAAGV